MKAADDFIVVTSKQKKDHYDYNLICLVNKLCNM